MKKQTMYNRLQKQYEKLNQRIQKAMQTGRFYAYTQFKQQQLLSRLKRCSFQLKHLGAGVAVVAALGMATPVVGQTVDFQQQTGTNNPFNGFTAVQIEGSLLVDIDTDGDLDLFILRDVGGGTLGTDFYENTGTDVAPNFLLQAAANNPLNNFTDKSIFAFVDIDGDGDQDLFTSRDPVNYQVEELNYYENTAMSGMAQFTLQAPVDNPLDSALMHVADLGAGLSDVYFGFFPSFVDMDGDGDQDCFMGVSSYDYAIGAPFLGVSGSDKLWYYENTGTPSAPIFERQSLANNPAAGLFSTSVVSGRSTMRNVTDFIDLDEDGDYDMITYFDIMGGGTSSPIYFNNNGTSMDSVGFSGSVLNDLSPTGFYSFADIDADGDLDAVRAISNTLLYYKHEGLIVSTTTIPTLEESISVYPNPTTGKLLLEEAVTGQLQIFNSAGQEVYARELEQEQELNLSSLEAGLYLLRIKEDRRHLQQTILIQK